jgi:predicted metalloprotease
MVSERVKVHVGLAAALGVFVASVSPDFSLRDAENQPVALSELRGNVVIVYFHGRDVSGLDASTTQPSEVTAAEANTSSASAEQIPTANGSAAKTVSASSDDASPTIAQLSAMARQVHNPRLKVLELDTLASLGNTDSNSAVSDASAQLPTQSQAGTDSTVRTLFDLSGDVARKYKIDSEEAHGLCDRSIGHHPLSRQQSRE